MAEEETGGTEATESVETLGQRWDREAYEDFRRELEALPNAAEFQALVKEWGPRIGYRRVGQWIAARGPKPAQPAAEGPEAATADKPMTGYERAREG